MQSLLKSAQVESTQVEHAWPEDPVHFVNPKLTKVSYVLGIFALILTIKVRSLELKWWSYRCYKLKNQVNFFTYISLPWAELIALSYI